MLSIRSLSIRNKRVSARIVPLLLLAFFGVLLFVPQQVLAKEYKNSDGDKGQYDLIVKLSGESSKVDRVTAVRVVPNYSDKKYVNNYDLTKKDATTYRQDHFQFITDNMSCRQIPSLIAQNPGGGLGQSSGFYDFKVTAYDKSNKKISPTVEVTFDYGDDCGKDKTINLAVSSTQTNPNSLGTLNGSIEAYEFGKKIPLKTVDLRLTGPADKKMDYDPETGSLKAIEIPPGTYTLSGPVRCGSSITGNTCTTNDDFTTTGPIKAGNNKIDIVYIDGERNICGDGCDKAALVAKATGAPGPGGTDDGPSPDCQSSGFTLSWIACPIVDGLAKAVDGIYAGLIKPLLVTKPIDTSGTATCEAKDTYRGCDYAVWSEFRIYGNILLIIALLVIVFGQSIGGGLVDAYTAKKVLPRLLAAAILINLSIYIVAFLVDITNILGNGIQSLMTQPFKNADAFKLTLNAGSSTVIAGPAILATGLGIAALLGSGGVIWASIAAIASPVLPALVGFLALFVLLPAILIMIAILATVIIRNGLLIFLVMTAPVAFALYCLPNTEKYFKKWWELLWKTLLIYPIIAVIFAIGDILSITMSQGGSSNGLLAVIAQLMGVIALIAPLFLIPFAFKIAGGLIGRFYDVANKSRIRAQEGIKGNANLPGSLRNRVKGRLTGAAGAGGAQAFRNLDKYQNDSKYLKNDRMRPTLRGRAAGLVAGSLAGSIESEALRNAAAKQRIENIKNNGDDSVINARASFMQKGDDDIWRRKTLDGKDVTDVDYAAAKKLFPTLSDAQAVADYRSSKILSTADAEQFTQNFGAFAAQEGLTPEQTTGTYTSLAFARQNERGEFKFGKYEKQGDKFVFKPVGGEDSIDDGRAHNFVKTEYAKRGSYAGSQLYSSYFQAMGDVKQKHVDRIEKLDNLGVLTPEQQQQRQASKDELKKIYEIQEAFTSSSMDPDNPGEYTSGMQGASAETKAAFNKLIEMDQPPITPAEALPPGVSGPAAPPSATPTTKAHHLYAEISKEIRNGQTYEAEHSRDYGSGR